MNNAVVKNALSYSLGEDLHNNWCNQELYSFFLRFQQNYNKSKNPGQALGEACYIDGKKRNEVEVDTDYIVNHPTQADELLKSFEVFKNLFTAGIIEVKRFTKRTLTEDEIKKSGDNYIDGMENILRPFNQISSQSKYDNLEAARVAIEMVFDKTMAGEQISHEESEEMASTIHDEWLKRNDWVFDPNYGDPKLAVPFAQLSQEEQDKNRAQLGPAQAKVQAYMAGKIDVEAICEQYGLSTSSRTR